MTRKEEQQYRKELCKTVIAAMINSFFQSEVLRESVVEFIDINPNCNTVQDALSSAALSQVNSMIRKIKEYENNH